MDTRIVHKQIPCWLERADHSPPGTHTLFLDPSCLPQNTNNGETRPALCKGMNLPTESCQNVDGMSLSKQRISASNTEPEVSVVMSLPMVAMVVHDKMIQRLPTICGSV
ncbi:unnamed protein product [Ectocarpus sp. 12 AP-2014]